MEKDQIAEIMSLRMPLVHFPARAVFERWSGLEALQSARARGQEGASGEFDQLRWINVFTFAGPCCYTDPSDIGDTAMYFGSSVESGNVGDASAFDSGALEVGILKPWDAMDVRERWAFLRRNSVTLATWRGKFSSWLSHCYEDPSRYLDTWGDRYSDGLPDRTQPPEIRDYNGAIGRSRSPGVAVADRRAWTWEVRLQVELPLAAVDILHIPFDLLESALQTVHQRGWNARIRTLPPDEVASPDALYRHSGPLVSSYLFSITS